MVIVELFARRFICGTQDLHKQLEATVASFHGMDDAILYSSCFDANAGLFEVLLTEQDAVISDELNHASIIDGVLLVFLFVLAWLCVDVTCVLDVQASGFAKHKSFGTSTSTWQIWRRLCKRRKQQGKG